MRKTLTWIAVAASMVVVALGLKIAIGRYRAVADAARAMWDDPAVRKVRRRATKRMRKAAKKISKAANRR